MNETKETIEQPNSYEISINSKGLYSGKIKVYAKTIEEARKQATKESIMLEALIKSKNGL